MLLLATQAEPQMREHRHPNLGRLVQPRHYPRIRQTARSGVPWAADNDAFNGWGQDSERRFLRMIETLSGLPGCLFVVCPDVVGEAGLTSLLFEEYAPLLWRHGVPPAYVLQEPGVEYDHAWIPWGALGALFIGGASTEFKLGPEVAQLVGEARARNVWVHMGRVNSRAGSPTPPRSAATRSTAPNRSASATPTCAEASTPAPPAPSYVSPPRRRQATRQPSPLPGTLRPRSPPHDPATHHQPTGQPRRRPVAAHQQQLRVAHDGIVRARRAGAAHHSPPPASTPTRTASATRAPAPPPPPMSPGGSPPSSRKTRSGTTNRRLPTWGGVTAPRVTRHAPPASPRGNAWPPARRHAPTVPRRVRYALAGRDGPGHGPWVGQASRREARVRRERVSPAPASRESADPRERFAGPYLAGECSTLSSLNRRGVTKVAPRRSLPGTLHPRQSPGEEPSAPERTVTLVDNTATLLQRLDQDAAAASAREEQRNGELAAVRVVEHSL